MTRISERDDYRYLFAGGRLVYAVVVGQLINDDTISLFGVEIDLHGTRCRPIITCRNSS